MKKKKLITALLLSIVAFCGTFCACSEEKNSAQDGVLIHGFESYAAAKNYTYEEWFGRAEINTDEAFVSEGNASLHVFPMGDFDKKEEYPYVGVNTSDKANVFYEDFSAFRAVTLDVYNPSEEQLKIGLCLQADTGAAEYVSTALQYYTLEPKQWTVCEYETTAAMKYAFDDLSSVARVMIAFTDRKQSVQEQYKDLYIDNLRGIAGKTGDYSVRRSADGEFLSFEKADDKNVFDYFWLSKYACYMTDAEICPDVRYASSGSNSLKLTLRPSFVDYSATNDSAYVGVSMGADVLAGVFDGCNAFSFDVYNDCDTAQTVKVRYYLATYEEIFFTLPPKSIVTCVVKDEKLSAVSRISVKFADEYIMNNGGKDKVFYLDRFCAYKENV